MIRNSVVVRVGCSGCGDFFDVDLQAIRQKRGPHYSLVGRHCTCRRTLCRGRAYFVAAASLSDELRTLVTTIEDPLKLKGLLASDLEPPLLPTGPGRGPGRPSIAGIVDRFAQHIATSPSPPGA